MRSPPFPRLVRVISALLVAAPLSALAIAGTAGASPIAASGAAADDAIGGAAMGTTATVTSAGTPAVPVSVTAAGFVVADLDSGAVYAARNPHLHAPPASTLKTLTALVLLPRLEPSQVVVANDADASVDGTRVGIVPQGRYTVEQLFQAMLMMSGNDAAELLARTAGSRAGTLAEMNAKAKELQAFDTYAGTPSGLDAPGQTSSPYDLALINRATMALPAFRRYVAMRQSTFGAAGGAQFAIQNKNRLFRHDYPGAIGIKDGFTDAAQHTYIGAATRAGRTYLVSLVRADRTYWLQAQTLLDWAFALPISSEPVGQLVDPIKPGEPSPLATSSAGTGPAAVATKAATGQRGQRGWVVPGLAGALLVTAVLIVSVRRQTVRRRTLVRQRARPG